MVAGRLGRRHPWPAGARWAGAELSPQEAAASPTSPPLRSAPCGPMPVGGGWSVTRPLAHPSPGHMDAPSPLLLLGMPPGTLPSTPGPALSSCPQDILRGPGTSGGSHTGLRVGPPKPTPPLSLSQTPPLPQPRPQVRPCVLSSVPPRCPCFLCGCHCHQDVFPDASPSDACRVPSTQGPAHSRCSVNSRGMSGFPSPAVRSDSPRGEEGAGAVCRWAPSPVLTLCGHSQDAPG